MSLCQKAYLMIPVIQEEYAKILIVVFGGGSVDENATKDTLPRLQRKVRMVPRGAILRSPPSISNRLAWCGWALGDLTNAILLVRIQLPDAVKMNACAVVRCRE